MRSYLGGDGLLLEQTEPFGGGNHKLLGGVELEERAHVALQGLLVGRLLAPTATVHQ